MLIIVLVKVSVLGMGVETSGKASELKLRTVTTRSARVKSKEWDIGRISHSFLLNRVITLPKAVGAPWLSNQTSESDRLRTVLTAGL